VDFLTNDVWNEFEIRLGRVDKLKAFVFELKVICYSSFGSGVDLILFFLFFQY